MSDHVRGGSVLPFQGGGKTTVAARQTPFELVVAIDGSGQAEGDLFLEGWEQVSVAEYTLSQVHGLGRQDREHPHLEFPTHRGRRIHRWAQHTDAS